MALENKLNIMDSIELARMEEKISKKKAVELFENGYLDKYKARKLSICTNDVFTSCNREC